MGWRHKLMATLSAITLTMGWHAHTLASSLADPLLPLAVKAPPAELQDVLPLARLIGQARLSVWGFKIYDARLWSPPGLNPRNFASQPLALELAYLRDFTAADIVERSLKEMRRSASLSAAQAQQWTAEMLRVFPDVKAGDRVLFLHRPGISASFWHNGRPVGEIADPEFARLFFGIWLSLQTSEPAMRLALLGSTAREP
jgi:hypothetical protein